MARLPAQHGTEAMYGRGCRCDLCRITHNDRVRSNRDDRLASGRLSHGTRSAYDAGCRCDPCRIARSCSRLAGKQAEGVPE